MEQAHATHKDAAWGWFAVLLYLLDGFPRHRARSSRTRGLSPRLTVRTSA
jgi:hypothetical protein